MIKREKARAIAQQAAGDRQEIDAALCTETVDGWYFPYAPRSEVLVGSNGVIVSKHTGRALVLGSAFSVERDIKAFDEGFQFGLYDLVILDIRDRPATIETLLEIGPTITIPEYEHGTVWKIPRRLTKAEIAEHLDSLPAVFSNITLYFRIEALQKARAQQYFRFEAREAIGPGAG